MPNWFDTLALRIIGDSFRPIPQPEPDPPPARSPNAKRPKMATGVPVRSAYLEQAPKVAINTITKPPEPDSIWRDLNLDSQTLSRISPSDALTLLADIAPDISSGQFTFLRLANPGWEYIVTDANGNAVSEGAGVDLMRSFIELLERNYGTVDVQINRCFSAVFLYGAVMGELVIGRDRRSVVDFIVVDPRIAQFKLISDPDRGRVWQLGQTPASGGQWQPITSPTVRYIPLDPLPDRPYGRSLAAPALSSSIFLLGLLHDLRRVVAQQGYPRIDIVVKLEELRDSMPQEAQDSPEAYNEWVNDTIDEISAVYNNLEPDDAFVHTSPVQVNRPIGTVDSSSLGAVEGLIRVIERQITRGLKTIPLLMGSNEATSETHANRQWEIYAAQIRSIQHLVETLLGSLCTLMLQIAGVQGTVTWRFAELRASEEMRDEQVKAAKLANAQTAYQAGYISHEEAAQNAVGHAPDAPAPRTMSAAPTVDTTPPSETGVTAV
jgi:hypothetical protein